MNAKLNDTQTTSSTGELHFNNSQIIIEYSDILPTQFLSDKINELLNEFLLFCPDQSKIRTSFNWNLDQWNVVTEVTHNLKSFVTEATKINPFDALKDAIEKLKSEIREWRKDRYGRDASYSRELKVVSNHNMILPENKIKVLLIDDDPITVKLIESCFRQQGCDTMIATNGSDAVRMFENMNYDLIVLDWIMPDLNGEEVIKQGELNINHSLHNEDFVKIPVLTYSAHGFQDINFPETTHFTQLGHIKKTTTYKRLRNKTNVILNRVKKLKYATVENRT